MRDQKLTEVDLGIMKTEDELANNFIKKYMAFLVFAYKECCEVDDETELLNKLSLGRDAFLKDRNLLSEYLARSNEKDSIIYDAIASLDVGEWIYLRDTTKYSLFIKTDQSASYAVLGLTQPVKEIFGCSGLYMKTGIVRLGANFVCDGIISNQVQLGRNYRDDINSIYKSMKSNGKFHRHTNA